MFHDVSIKNRMNLIFTLLLPLFITAVPLLFLQVFGRPQLARGSTGATLAITGMATLLGIFTPVLAAFVGVSSLPRPERGYELRCFPVSVLYLPLGYAITLVTLVLGVYYSIIVKKRRKHVRQPQPDR